MVPDGAIDLCNALDIPPEALRVQPKRSYSGVFSGIVSRFNDEHFLGFILAQSGSQDHARQSSSDDDIVVLMVAQLSRVVGQDGGNDIGRGGWLVQSCARRDADAEQQEHEERSRDRAGLTGPLRHDAVMRCVASPAVTSRQSDLSLAQRAH
jgi:hypothetical protein